MLDSLNVDYKPNTVLVGVGLGDAKDSVLTHQVQRPCRIDLYIRSPDMAGLEFWSSWNRIPEVYIHNDMKVTNV